MGVSKAYQRHQAQELNRHTRQEGWRTPNSVVVIPPPNYHVIPGTCDQRLASRGLQLSLKPPLIFPLLSFVGRIVDFP